VHSILPIAPRVKQPALHYHTCHTVQTAHSVPSGRHTKSPTTLGCGTRPVSIGSRRRRAECAEYFGAISVFVHVRSALWVGGWVGGNSASSERDQKLLHMLGHYVSQQCQYPLVSVENHGWKLKSNNIGYKRKSLLFLFGTDKIISKMFTELK